MTFLFWYFLEFIFNEIFLWNPKKYYICPSKLLYYLRFIIPQIILVYYLYQVSRNFNIIYGYLWTPFHVMILLIISILTIDIVEVIIHTIASDFRRFLIFDYAYTSRDIYGPYYSDFERRIAYYNKYSLYSKQETCPINLQDFDFENDSDSISLLKCGHIFHTQCIDIY